MQYRTGTVQFTNGNQTVIGTGTNWTAGTVRVGHQIHHVDTPLVGYVIGAIDYATQTIVLSSQYAGPSDPAASYVVTTEFTNNFNIPELAAGDLHAPAIITRALRQIDAALAEILANGGGGTPTESEILVNENQERLVDEDGNILIM